MCLNTCYTQARIYSLEEKLCNCEFQRYKYYSDFRHLVTSWTSLFESRWPAICGQGPIYCSVKTTVHHASTLQLAIIPPSDVIHKHKSAWL